MKRLWMLFLICCALVITIACTLLRQPIQNSDSQSVSNDNSEVDTGGNPVISTPNNELLAYVTYSVDMSSNPRAKFGLNLIDPDNTQWGICITCKLPADVSFFANVFYPVWSPDHTKIALIGNRLDYENQTTYKYIYMANLEGDLNLLQTLENPGFKMSLDWSPDGQKILVWTSTSLNIIDTKSGMQDVISIEWLGNPAWLDNQTIAYVSDRDNGEISTITLSTPSPKILTQLNILMDMDFVPIWSPNRENLIVNGRISGESGFYVVDLEGKVLAKLKLGDPGSYYILGANTEYSWSPDSRKIVFSTPSNDDGLVDVYVVDLRTGVQTRLTDSPDNEIFPSWSPKGDRIVFYNFLSGSISVMDADGTNVKILVSLPNDAITVSSSPELFDFFIPIWR